jgi:probable phosphoglycerate mutase
MMTTVHLVRHGHHALLGKQLCGRMRGIALDESGCEQMDRLAALLEPAPGLIQSSPRHRARQSASILAEHFGLVTEIAPAVDEIDVGDWTSLTFDELEQDPRWRLWNERRSSHRPPHGESMLEVRHRIVRHLEELRESTVKGPIVIVSHAEPIRAALLHYLGLSPDDFLSIKVDPASISTLLIKPTHIEIAGINQQGPA